MNITDGELLRRYAHERSETAFEDLVQRHVNLIFSAALRQVNGDAQLAEDVTQSVFTDLARKAAQLTRHPSLTGWLYTSTRFVAANILRTEQRRTAREQEAHAMNACFNSPAPEPDWAQIRPLLDDAMHTLDEKDREAVLLRHFEHRSFAEIGAQLGVAENAARMRVNRALEKLEEALRKRGVTSTALALAGLLSANGVGAAPAHLAASVARAALTAAASAGGLPVLLGHLFTVTKIKAAAAALLVAGVVATVATAHHRQSAMSLPAVRPTTLAAAVTLAVAPSTAVASAPNTPRIAARGTAQDTNGLLLHLEIVEADSGQPVPLVPIDYRSRSGVTFQGKKLVSSRQGGLDVYYPTNITELELTTRKDEFADTKLLWRPSNGDVIPTNYVLRLDRGTPIGGRVVDADGNGVAGAKVGWNHGEEPVELKLPQNHEFGWIEVSTDNEGRWRINRIGADMISRLYGSARDTNYIDSPMLTVSQDKTAEKQLLEETHVFRLGRGVTAKGVVVDGNRQAVAEAKVLVGLLDFSGSRQGISQSDGTFSIAGCPPGKQSVTATAAGYSGTTLEANLAADSEPLRLVLQAAKILRLRVVDKDGQPVPKAQIVYEHTLFASQGSSGPNSAQVDFNAKTDSEGRAIWTNAPDVEMDFGVMARGYTRKDNTRLRPDGEEHTITLLTALTVHGAVSDATTGQPIPHFRIVLGWPESNPISGSTSVHWSTLARFWLDFAKGTYRHAFEEPVIGGGNNPGYVMKFEAEGYASFISRTIAPDEGDVQLDVALKPAIETIVTVYKPDGQLAASADVGLVSPGARLSLIQGGFDRRHVQSGGSLLKTEADGTFKLPADESLLHVIVASPDGYAEALPATLATNPVLQLQPWGGLQITCVSGGQPEAGREFQLELGGGSPETVSFGFKMAHVISDAQGQISVAQLPPGQHHLIRVYSLPIDNGGTAFMQGSRTPFQIRSGETTTLTLDTNYTIAARLQWPSGMSRSTDWHISTALTPLTPAATGETHPWPHAQPIPATVNPDDTVTVQDVPAGSYDLSVVFYTAAAGDAMPLSVHRFPDMKIMVAGDLNVTVPSEPVSGHINAGVVSLQPGSDAH